MSSIDLDKFPTSETAKRMLKRVSPVYQNSYTAKWLYQVMGMELDEARSIVESLRDQAFTQTVTWAIEMQEHKYSIEPDESLTLDERRTRLFRKKTVKHPANPWFYENYIKNGWGIETELDEVALSWGRLLLTILRDDDNHLHAMLKDLREKKPSHLTLEAVWRLIFGDEEDAIQEHINANDGQAGDFDILSLGAKAHLTLIAFNLIKHAILQCIQIRDDITGCLVWIVLTKICRSWFFLRLIVYFCFLFLSEHI